MSLTNRGVTGVFISIIGISLMACTASGTRPHFQPLPGSVVDTLGAPPRVVIDALARSLGGRGIELRRLSVPEGYLETVWFDIADRRTRPADHLETGRVIRLRAYADSVPPGRTRLTLEAVYRRTADPSLPDRGEEIVLPPGHPGDSLTQRLLDGLPGRRR